MRDRCKAWAPRGSPKPCAGHWPRSSRTLHSVSVGALDAFLAFAQLVLVLQFATGRLLAHPPAFVRAVCVGGALLQTVAGQPLSRLTGRNSAVATAAADDGPRARQLAGGEFVGLPTATAGVRARGPQTNQDLDKRNRLLAA